ncbi:MAG TPA: hypothetical protein VNC82_01780 [Candidatus Limnocylindria bacterium]|nr:hypothetical protein [Candidatus Limnocylindria bacterium]
MKVWRETVEEVVVEDRVYPVTPASMTVKTGMITGEVIELKVTERVEKGSERVVSPARLTGQLRLKNTSANRTVRLVEGRVLFIDAQGQRIRLEAARIDPIIRFTTYGNERLNPGEGASQALDVEFPVEALKASRLKEIRLDLAYISSPFREETVNFVVSIGAGR